MKTLLKWLGLFTLCLILLPVLPLVVGSFLAYKLFKKTEGKKKWALAALIILGSIVLSVPSSRFFLSSSNSSPTPPPRIEEETTMPSVTPIDPRDEPVKVIRVIDGDTVEIEGGQDVRMIGFMDFSYLVVY